MTPEQWLQYLCERMDARAPRLAKLRARLDGDGPLPEGADRKLRDAYKEFQRRARTNFAALVTDAVAERMVISGVRVDDGAGDDNTARAIMRRNRVGIVAPDVHRDMLGVSTGYVSVTGQPGRARIVYERPEQVITEADPLDPWTTLAGLKVWRDKVREHDYAALSLPGVMYRWRRPHRRESGVIDTPIQISGGWIPESFTEQLAPWVAFVPFLNAGSVSEFEQHEDILGRIDYGILQRLVVMAMQAYRQRATKGELPELDEAGNRIDYGALLTPGAGALWHLPEGVELWESAQSDMTWLLSAVKDDIRDLSAVTRTPLSTLIPDGANQSADGASFAREGLVFKTGNRIERARASWSQVLAQALAVQAGAEELPEVDVSFKPAAHLSLSERADAATKATDLPWRTRMADIWGYDGDAIDRMEAERSQDALVLGLTQAPVAPGLPAAPQPAELPAAG